MELSNEQLQAIKHTHGPALILAVPGAGKTTVLIHRTRNLILNHHIRPERILSITFSKASALDMKIDFMILSKSSQPKGSFFYHPCLLLQPIERVCLYEEYDLQAY